MQSPAVEAKDSREEVFESALTVVGGIILDNNMRSKRILSRDALVVDDMCQSLRATPEATHNMLETIKEKGVVRIETNKGSH